MMEETSIRATEEGFLFQDGQTALDAQNTTTKSQFTNFIERISDTRKLCKIHVKCVTNRPWYLQVLPKCLSPVKQPGLWSDASKCDTVVTPLVSLLQCPSHAVI